MPIRVILVEDSSIALTILKRILDSSPEIEVVGTASTGVEGLDLIPKVNPDVICTDLHMPKMNGLEFTKEVMASYPRPILVISASVLEDDVENIFNLLEAGAVDIFPKPRSGQLQDYESMQQPLINKIKVLSGIKVFTRRKHSSTIQKPQTLIQNVEINNYPKHKKHIHPFKIVGIGASTGGPQALSEIFSQLPKDFPLPIICVQHISQGFLQGFIDWLSNNCLLPIEIAKSGLYPKPGKIYFPLEGHHLQISPTGSFMCSKSPPVLGHRPSVTVTFKSLASYYGKGVIGILLTGMGKDGAEGLLKISESGGFTIAQNEATSIVFGMPHEAIKLGAADEILPIEQIAPKFIKKIIHP